MRVKRTVRAEGERDWRDYLVVILCLLGALFFVRLFWLDLNRAFARLSQAPIGTITWKYKVAQSRFFDRTLWARLQQGSPIWNGDYVRTADHSEAAIHFPEGVSIDMEENCLVQIFFEDAIPLIFLNQGSMSVDASASTKGGALVLDARRQSISVAGGTVLDARIGQSGIFNLRLSEGRASFDRDGETRTLTGGEILSIDIDGNVFVEARTVMISPRPGVRLLSRDGPAGPSAPVDFVWKGVSYAEGERTRLELAADRSFQRIVHTRNGGADGETRIDLADGVWFWRAYPVRAEGTDTEESAANAAMGRVIVNPAPVPRGLSPQEGAVYYYRSRPPDIRFQWTSSAEVAYYVVEAADNPGFGDPALQITVRGSRGETGSLTDSSLGSGRWYWRVQPVLGDEYQDSLAPSAPRSFTIIQGDALPAPTLLSPLAGISINTLKTADVYFSWQNEAEAAFYTLLVSTSPGLEDPVITRQVSDQYYRSTETLPDGLYYWSVYQSAGDGTVSAVSPPRSFTLMTGDLRVLFPPDNYTLPPGQMPEFTWKTDLPYPLRFQVSDTPSFTRLRVDQSAAGDAFRPPALETGQWYWRINALTGGGNVQTAARSFRVVPAPLLREPAQRRPANGYVLGPDQLRTSRRITFTWNAVPGANRYTFALYRETGNGRTLIRRQERASQTSYILDDLSILENGRFVWQVEALRIAEDGSLEQRGTAGENRFTLNVPVPGRNTPRDPGIIYGE
jgi:hypothetical protein